MPGGQVAEGGRIAFASGAALARRSTQSASPPGRRSEVPGWTTRRGHQVVLSMSVFPDAYPFPGQLREERVDRQGRGLGDRAATPPTRERPCCSPQHQDRALPLDPARRGRDLGLQLSAVLAVTAP